MSAVNRFMQALIVTIICFIGFSFIGLGEFGLFTALLYTPVGFLIVFLFMWIEVEYIRI